MQINNGTEPRQDFKDFLDEVITEHDCPLYANIKCRCTSGECEQRFRDGKLGDNDLEQFDKEALEFFIMFINYSINLMEGLDLENLQALRMMMYNAIQKVKTK